MKITKLFSLASFALAVPAANASIVLYSSNFSGSSGTDLNGTAVNTSGATGAQHTQYGTSASATWSAHVKFKADGSFADAGTNNSPVGNNRNSATLAFTPQNGYVYNLTMTTSFVQTVTAFHAVGYFETAGYTGDINSASGADVWALTRPGDTTAINQVGHYNETGGAGNVNPLNTIEDTTAPSTLRIRLDTIGGAGNWAATYFIGDGSGGFSEIGSKSLSNVVTIGSVGIGVYNADGAANFQSFELSVIPEPSVALLGGFGALLMLRRRR